MSLMFFFKVTASMLVFTQNAVICVLQMRTSTEVKRVLTSKPEQRTQEELHSVSVLGDKRSMSRIGDVYYVYE